MLTTGYQDTESQVLLRLYSSSHSYRTLLISAVCSGYTAGVHQSPVVMATVLWMCNISWVHTYKDFWAFIFHLITLRTKLSGTVYCNRSCLFVCMCVYLWVCYHDNSKLRASIFTKLGLSAKVVTISSWLNCGRPVPPGRGSAVGQKNFLAPPYYSQHTEFASLWVLFSLILIYFNKKTIIFAAEMAVRCAALSAWWKVHVCHCNSLGGATWRSITGRTDRQTDIQSATQYAAPS